jgi:hypothetical protein
MPELRTINLDNLSDAIRIMNESSHGMSIEYKLDTFSFLFLSQYWNFSYQYSLLDYVDGEAAAVIIVCTEPETHDAFIFYWGALPRFWKQNIALPLFEACCSQLHQDGYCTLYGAAAPDRPTRRYRFIQSHPQYTLIDIGTISQSQFPADEPVHWCQRLSFLCRASRFLQCLGAYENDALTAHAVIFPQPATATLVDVRSPDNCLAAGYELLHWLITHDFQLPLTATTVIQGTYSDRLLCSAGFSVRKQWTTLHRDLRTTCAPRRVSA